MADDSLNSVTFLDIACLLKITQDTTLEKFGGVINASVFDAANIAGTLKQKGLITFSSGFPGPTGMQLTDAAKNLLNDINARSSEPADTLDNEILVQLSGGKRLPNELQSALNLVPKDLAYRLYKLYKQNLLNYELRNGNVELLLTEQGFLKAKAAPSQASTVQAQAQANGAQPQAQEQQEAAAEVTEMSQMQNELPKPKNGNTVRNIAVLLAAIVIIIIAIVLRH
ncbi:MAG: hypothetical protein ACP5T3_02330 [Candidatus Micrarchaeia archaeon]